MGKKKKKRCDITRKPSSKPSLVLFSYLHTLEYETPLEASSSEHATQESLPGSNQHPTSSSTTVNQSRSIYLYRCCSRKFVFLSVSFLRKKKENWIFFVCVVVCPSVWGNPTCWPGYKLNSITKCDVIAWHQHAELIVDKAPLLSLDRQTDMLDWDISQFPASVFLCVSALFLLKSIKLKDDQTTGAQKKGV